MYSFIEICVNQFVTQAFKEFNAELDLNSKLSWLHASIIYCAENTSATQSNSLLLTFKHTGPTLKPYIVDKQMWSEINGSNVWLLSCLFQYVYYDLPVWN